MDLLKEGDIVSRNSYNNDILFYIEKIDGANQTATLKGVVVRIQADSDLTDLSIPSNTRINDELSSLDDIIENRNYENIRGFGKILHLDGDKRYSEKTEKYYKKQGLNYVVKHISERQQPEYIIPLLEKVQPDILVITGHDGMIRNGRRYGDVSNYKNSKYFIKSVRQARLYNSNKNDLIIYAGACQSFYEALISVGANFASSPARILIDFVDPLIVAETVSLTDRSKMVFMSDLEGKIRNGRKAVGGIGARGKNM